MVAVVVPSATNTPTKGGGWEWPSRAEGAWRHRAARLGWSATALAVIAVLVLAAGVWAFISEKLSPGSDNELLFDDPRWQLWLTAAGAAWVVAAYVGVAALETAAAMRVLSPDRPLPKQRPHVLRVGLTGAGALAADPVMSTPEWPASALSPTADMGTPYGARC